MIGGQGRSGDGDHEALKQELREKEASFERAAAAGDLDAFMAFWAEDAAYLVQGSPTVTGRRAIAAAWKPLLESPDAQLTWQPVKVEVAASGDLGYTFGAYQLRMKSLSGESVRSEGKYASIWRREADGRWLVVLDAGNSNT